MAGRGRPRYRTLGYDAGRCPAPRATARDRVNGRLTRAKPVKSPPPHTQYAPSEPRRRPRQPTYALSRRRAGAHACTIPLADIERREAGQKPRRRLLRAVEQRSTKVDAGPCAGGARVIVGEGGRGGRAGGRGGAHLDRYNEVRRLTGACWPLDEVGTRRKDMLASLPSALGVRRCGEWERTNGWIIADSAVPVRRCVGTGSPSPRRGSDRLYWRSCLATMVGLHRCNRRRRHLKGWIWVRSTGAAPWPSGVASCPERRPTLIAPLGSACPVLRAPRTPAWSSSNETSEW